MSLHMENEQGRKQQQQKPSVLQPVLSWLVGIATAAAVGSFVFCWNTNVNIALLLERDREKTESINKQQAAIDRLELSNNDLLLKVNDLSNRMHK